VASFHHAADGIVTTAIETPRFSTIASTELPVDGGEHLEAGRIGQGVADSREADDIHD